MNIRTLIIDDEPLARTRIRSLLAAESDVTVLAECANGSEAIEAVETHSPDLLFLDIQMPEVNGFDVLQAVGPERIPAVIFVTAYDQHALQAFEFHALDYLLKPFKQSRFKSALQRARYQLTNRSADHETRLASLLEQLRPANGQLTRFVIKTSSRMILLKARDVDWIESAANYALLHVGSETHLLRETMRSLEDRLSPNQFQRISRSAIVNLDRIKEFQPMAKGEYIITLTNGKQLPMTRGIRELQQAIESH
ncbi:MAG: yehT 1 [Verrucomicrobia bacterium]|jgi:two-component system LytT family response regulator|nr:yehT 1 [Verrucomicrobiota bacterium]